VIFLNQSPALRPLDEPYNSIVAFLQEFSEFGDGGPASPCKPRDSEQELMLLRRQPAGARGLFTEAEEPPELVPEGGKLLQAQMIDLCGGRTRARFFHLIIISQCDVMDIGGWARAAGDFI